MMKTTNPADRFNPVWEIVALADEPCTSFSYFAHDPSEAVKHCSTLLFANTLFHSEILMLNNTETKPRIFYALPQPSQNAEWILSIEYVDAKVLRWEFSSAEDAVAELPKHLSRKDIERIDLRHKKHWPPTVRAQLDADRAKRIENEDSSGEPPVALN